MNSWDCVQPFTVVLITFPLCRLFNDRSRSIKTYGLEKTSLPAVEKSNCWRRRGSRLAKSASHSSTFGTNCAVSSRPRLREYFVLFGINSFQFTYSSKPDPTGPRQLARILAGNRDTHICQADNIRLSQPQLWRQR